MIVHMYLETHLSQQVPKFTTFNIQ